MKQLRFIDIQFQLGRLYDAEFILDTFDSEQEQQKVEAAKAKITYLIGKIEEGFRRAKNFVHRYRKEEGGIDEQSTFIDLNALKNSFYNQARAFKHDHSTHSSASKKVTGNYYYLETIINSLAQQIEQAEALLTELQTQNQTIKRFYFARRAIK